MCFQCTDLDSCEEVDSAEGYVAQVYVVRLVLGRHEDDGDALHELHTVQRRHAHEEEHAVQNRHRDQLCEERDDVFSISIDTGIKLELFFSQSYKNVWTLTNSETCSLKSVL